MSVAKNLQDCYFFYYSACRKVSFSDSIVNFYSVHIDPHEIFPINLTKNQMYAHTHTPFICVATSGAKEGELFNKNRVCVFFVHLGHELSIPS